MRIVYPVTWARLSREASQAQSVATAAALARRGHEVTLLLPQAAADPDLAADDLRSWFGVEGDFRVRQRRSGWAGDAVHRTVLRLAQAYRDPAVRGADLLYSRTPVIAAIGPLAPVPWAADHYRPWPDVYPVVRPWLRRNVRQPECLGLILHSHYAAEAYRRAGLPENKLLVAHNGYDPPGAPPAKGTARAQLGLPADRPIALYAGRINAAKGLDTLLALADRRPAALFVLVGSEGDGEIERAAAARTNVRIAPWAEPAALPAWLASADVLLIPPSRAPLERFGNCVLPLKLYAYLAAGRPILAPASPDTAELLQHGENAWLVPADDSEAAAAGLDRLLSDHGLAEQLSITALAVSRTLTWDRRAEKIEAFLRERLAQRSLNSSTVRPINSASTGAAQAPSTEGT
jgi:glycosyltransferase involved in cell wall biosynthesis